MNPRFRTEVCTLVWATAPHSACERGPPVGAPPRCVRVRQRSARRVSRRDPAVTFIRFQRPSA